MELPSRGRRWTIENASRDLFPVRKLSHSDNLVTAFVIASNPKDFPISDSPKGTVSPRITPSRPPLSPSLRNSNRITRRFSFLSLSLSYFSYPFSPPPPPLEIIKVILFPFLGSIRNHRGIMAELIEGNAADILYHSWKWRMEICRRSIALSRAPFSLWQFKLYTD